MKTLHLSLIIMFAVIIFLGFGLEPAHADYANSISIKKINVQPSTLKVGDKFTVTATLVNNSTTPIGLEGGTCSIKVLTVPFFTVSFDNHAKIKTQNLTCAGVGLSKILKPGEKLSGTSPDFTSTYVAIESGTANATITFAYTVINQTDSTQPNIEQKDSKSILFTIYDNNSIPMNDLHSHPVPFLASPLQQFKSGIAAKDVKCKEGLQLVIKSEDLSPACVTPDTSSILVKRGWTNDNTILPKNENSIKIPHVEPVSTNPFLADKNGKVDLTKIHLSYNQYGQIDYEKIGHVVSENQFKKILDEMNIPYAQNNLVMQDGMSMLTLPPFTDYCGYVKDNNTQEHWFSSSYHNDTLQNYKVYAINPEPCKPGPPFACFCVLQTHIAENNLKELSYFTTSEENTIGNTLSKYFDDGNVVNVSNEFVVGKYNLNIDPSTIHYCGKFTWGVSLTYFEGYVKNSTVVDFTLASEKQKLCAITPDAKLFSFNESANGIRK